jgi:hypothetical protein
MTRRRRTRRPRSPIMQRLRCSRKLRRDRHLSHSRKPSYVGGAPAPVRTVCLDTYQNFLKVALLLGWECDQSVFPVKIRTDSSTDSSADVPSDRTAMCQYDRAARTLSSLGQPDDTRVVFRIRDFKLVWIAYVWSEVNAQYCGQICLECMHTSCSMEALSFDEFLIITAIAYTTKSNSPAPGTVDNLACENSGLTGITAERALVKLYENTNTSGLDEAARNMSRSVLPGKSSDEDRPCYFEDFSSHNSNTPWMTFWFLYYAGDEADRRAATVSMKTRGRDEEETYQAIKKRSQRAEARIRSTSEKLNLVTRLAVSLGKDMIPFGNLTSDIAQSMASAVVGTGSEFTAAGRAWTIQKLSHNLKAFTALVIKYGGKTLPIIPGSITGLVEDKINERISGVTGLVEDEINERAENRIASKLRKVKKSVANAVAGFETRFGTIEDASAALAPKPGPAETANEKVEDIFVTSVRRLIILVDDPAVALQLFNSRACVADSTGGQMPPTSAVNGPLVALATTGIVSDVSSVEEALDYSMKVDDDEEEPHNPSTAEAKAKAEAKQLLGNAIDTTKANAVKATLVICRAEVEDAGRRAHVIGRIMDVWKKDLEKYVGIVRGIGPGLIKADPKNVIAATQTRDAAAQQVLDGLQGVIKALKEVGASECIKATGDSVGDERESNSIDEQSEHPFVEQQRKQRTDAAIMTIADTRNTSGRRQAGKPQVVKPQAGTPQAGRPQAAIWPFN